MPYIITMKRPGAQAREVRDLDCIVTFCCAVATLEKARGVALAGIGDRVVDVDFKSDTVTIGPLPDGTVIEVEHVTPGQLRVMVDGDDSYDEWMTDDELVEAIDTFNARKKAAL